MLRVCEPRFDRRWVRRADEALRKAVAEAIAQHRRNGVPIAIWSNSKVVRIPADQIEVREPQIEYAVSPKKGE